MCSGSAHSCHRGVQAAAQEHWSRVLALCDAERLCMPAETLKLRLCCALAARDDAAQRQTRDALRAASLAWYVS